MPWILHGICLCVKPDRDVWPICGLAFCRAEWGGMSRQLTKEHVDLGDRVRAARINAGLSQEEAAYRLRTLLPRGCSPGASVISRIESNKIASPEPYVVAAMAEIYEIPLVSAERRRAAVARIA